MKRELDIKKCEKCAGRSFLNGYCLRCDHDKANRATRASKDSLLAHCMQSIRNGFEATK